MEKPRYEAKRNLKKTWKKPPRKLRIFIKLIETFSIIIALISVGTTGFLGSFMIHKLEKTLDNIEAKDQKLGA